LREALAALGERHAAGLVVSDRTGRLLFATTRAKRLLGGTDGLTQNVDVARFIVESAAGEGTSDRIRTRFPGCRNPVVVCALLLAGTPRHLLLVLEEESPSTPLATVLTERFGLSARSIRLVHLVRRGLTNREIAGQMRLAEASVKTYLHALFREVGVRNRAELVSLAERLDRSPDDGAQLEHGGST
jgi:DNA-binding CsgD family transcriptional regulator